MFSWVRRNNVKTSTLPKVNLRFDGILSHMNYHVYRASVGGLQNLCRSTNHPENIVKTILSKKNKAKWHHNPRHKTYYKARVIKKVWSRHVSMLTDQWHTEKTQK